MGKIHDHVYNPNMDGYCMHKKTWGLCEGQADAHHLIRLEDRQKHSLEPSVIENKPAPRVGSVISKAYVKRYRDGYEIGPYDQPKDAQLTARALQDLTGDRSWFAYKRTETEETLDL